jgi:hypothetical protein
MDLTSLSLEHCCKCIEPLQPGCQFAWPMTTTSKLACVLALLEASEKRIAAHCSKVGDSDRRPKPVLDPRPSRTSLHLDTVGPAIGPGLHIHL